MFPKVATILIDAGADTNIADSEGLTPLYKAVWLCSETSGRRRVTKVLLERGADPNVAQCNGRTPMHTVACEGDEDLAKLLMDYGANPFIRDNKGRSAFSMAHEEQHGGIIQMIEARDRIARYPRANPQN